MEDLLFKELFSNYPKTDKDIFIKKINSENYAKARFFSYLLFAMSFAFFILSYTLSDSTPIIIANFVYFLVSTIIAFLSTLNNILPKKTEFINKLILYSLIISAVAWSTSLIAVNPNRNELVGTYAITILSISSVLRLRWQVDLVLYSTSLFSAIFLILPKLEPPLIPKLTVFFSLVVISWIVSRLLYSKEISNFTIKMTLEKQNSTMQKEILKNSIRLKNYEREKVKEILVSVAKLMDIHDPYTNGHSTNVAKLSQEIAIEMGLSDENINDAYWSGMVHDLGKLLIPIEILNKEGPLTDAEFKIIKAHPSYGYEVLCHSDSLSNIANYVLHHHEKWDGTGYTDNLAGDDIPLVSQILSVADSWDAMINERPYRQAMTEEKALLEIQKNRGKQFSPLVVDAFVQLHDRNCKQIESAC